mgnify:CR=1 FL=1
MVFVGMRLSVIGAGYVGLVSAVCFADRGYEVTLSTHDAERVKLINQAASPFYETGLQEGLERAVGSSRLRATASREEAVFNSDATFIASGTPSRADGSIDLTYIRKSSVEIGKALRKKDGYHLVVVRSTVVPGTTENVVKPSIEKHSGKEAGTGFGLVMQPEFLRQGSAIHDTMNPDRIIIGEYDTRSGETLESLYRDFYKDKLPPVLRMNLASAEMTKYASNAFLATKISYINEIANICEKVPGVDVVKVAEGLGLDERIGRKFLNAGAGFGGSCFPKDVNAIVAFAKSHRYRPRILESALEVNKDQATHVAKLIKKRLGTLRGKRVAVLGLSFKPGTDDLREAPSLRIIRQLLKEGVRVVVYDPVAINNTKRILGNKIAYVDSALSCLQDADAAVMVTEWDEFKDITPNQFLERMRHPLVIDGRRIYDADRFSKAGIQISAIGLGPTAHLGE